MSISEIEKKIFDLANELNINESDIRLIKSDEDRRNCFDELDKICFPVEPNITFEVVFSNDFLRFLILVFPDKIKSENTFRASFKREALMAVSKKEKYKKNMKSGMILLGILADYLNGNSTDSIMLDDDVCQFAKRHEVDGIVYYQTKDERLSNSYYKAIKRYSVNRHLVNSIRTRFVDSGIEHYFVKGGVVADHYPVPPLRTMGDCDVHIHPEDKLKASAILESLGFEREFNDTIEEWRFLNRNIVVELHDCPCEAESRATEAERAFFDNEWSYVHNNVAEQEYQFIYILSHLKKHLLSKGVGFRQFFDLAVELKYCKIDFDKIEKLCEMAGLKEFLYVCTSLCEAWFDVDLPFKTELTDDFISKATFIILHNGVFGVGKIINEDRLFSDLINNDGKIKTIVESFFLPYSAFISSEEYSWIVGKPFLLPIAWIVRFYRKLKNPAELRRGLHTVNKVSKTEKLQSEYYEWGL